MNSKTNISTSSRVLVLMLGFFVALFTLASGYVKSVQSDDITTKEVTQQQEDQSQESNATISSFDAITNVLQINLPNFDDFSIARIIIEFSENTELVELREKGTTKFFKTLFRRIISPNAP